MQAPACNLTPCLVLVSCSMLMLIKFLVDTAVITVLMWENRKDHKEAVLGLFGGNKKQAESHNLALVDEVLAETSGSVRVLLRASDLYPEFISANFERVFGVPATRVADDIETLLRFVPETDRAPFRHGVSEWDRKEPLTLGVDYVMPTRAGSDAASGFAVSDPAAASNPDVAETKHFRVTLTSLKNGFFTLVELVDVTAEHDTLAQVRAERDAANEVAQNRTDFFSQMSHEIRTPLNGIKGMISLARDHRTDEDRLLDDLSRVDELSDYLLSLVNDILDMGRLSSGRVELERLPFDMRLVAEQIRTMFEGQASDKGINFAVELDENECGFLLGDSMRLNRIIINFVSNALKFTDAGGRVTVTFREMYRHDDEVNYMIRVRDTGKGMDPRFVSRIFKPFEQEDRTIARRYGGTGLGVPIAGALIELAGGEVVVDTELGRGTDFTAYIPFGVASGEQVAELVAHGETLETCDTAGVRGPEYVFEGKRFLMAEDNAVNAMIAVEVMAKLGVQVDVADDGPVAIDMFAKSAPGTYDAILMDIQMPTLNGWEATARIRRMSRRDASTIPIIALSANNFAEDARRSQEAGMNGHVGKPLDYQELKAQLAVAAAEATRKGANA